MIGSDQFQKTEHRPSIECQPSRKKGRKKESETKIANQSLKRLFLCVGSSIDSTGIHEPTKCNHRISLVRSFSFARSLTTFLIHGLTMIEKDTTTDVKWSRRQCKKRSVFVIQLKRYDGTAVPSRLGVELTPLGEKVYWSQ